MRNDRGLGVNVCMEVTVLNVSQSTKACMKLILGSGRKLQEEGEKSYEGELRLVESNLLPSTAVKAKFSTET